MKTEEQITVDQLFELIFQAKNGRISRSDLNKFLADPDNWLMALEPVCAKSEERSIAVEQLARLFADDRITEKAVQRFLTKSRLYQPDYTVLVDYRQPLWEMEMACLFEQKPISKRCWKKLEKIFGLQETRSCLYDFEFRQSKDTTRGIAYLLMEDFLGKDWSPANLKDLLAFGAAYPKVQEKFPIASFESLSWKGDFDFALSVNEEKKRVLKKNNWDWYPWRHDIYVEKELRFLVKKAVWSKDYYNSDQK